MVTLEREKTKHILFKGESVSVKFNVPTAEEFSTKIRGVKDLSDVDVVKAFVTKIQSNGITGWEEGISADQLCKAPGTFSLVSEIAVEIINSAVLTEKEKN